MRPELENLQVRVVRGEDKKTGKRWVDFPDCPEPYRTMLREVSEHQLKVQAIVDEQARDEALWSVPAEGTQPIAEAYLQQELRKLHATIESD